MKEVNLYKPDGPKDISIYVPKIIVRNPNDPLEIFKFLFEVDYVQKEEESSALSSLRKVIEK